LLTVQAFELYLARLAPNGALALHLTSRHLDLAPVVAGIASELGLETLEIATPKDEARALLDARWILVARTRELFTRPRLAAAGHALELGGKRPLVFTDDYSNLFAVLK
jgi:hypothetical protein